MTAEPALWTLGEAARADGYAGRTHVQPLRVYYEDTDAAGIVYYANYLNFAERARTEMLRSLGNDHTSLLASAGVIFVVRQCHVDYRRPARLDDRLEVHTEIAAVGGASVAMVQRVIAADTAPPIEHACLRIRLACTDRTHRPARLPAAVRDRLRPLLAPPAGGASPNINATG